MTEPHPRLLLQEVFQERARSTPEGIALLEGERFITYSDLEARARAVAGNLRDRGIQDGSSVGLHVERSIDWVVGMLGILRANAAVVPLPPSYPVDRLREILAFAELDAVIDGDGTPLHPSLEHRAIPLEDLSSGTGSHEKGTPGHPDQPAFVLASSGSTGRPKMIVRSHRSFFHRLHWTWERHPYAEGEVCCQKAHMTTTHAIYELFEPLLAGTPVLIIPDPDVRNLERFWEVVRGNNISRLLIVPSALRASLDMPGFTAPPLEVLVLMGEYLHSGLAERVVAAFPGHTHLYSIYGSTEASSTLVCNLRESLRPGEELPLGKPISQEVRPHVLGADLEAIAPGDAGRLYMAGPALFSEYFRDPDLTASVFSDGLPDAGRLYDTKDQVRRMPDGNLQFIGRVDDTVKIRGFRVELPEVERAMLLHPGVRQATVAVNDGNPGSATLVGFFVPAAVDSSEVFRTLRERLPAYMVPSALLGLDAFPLTHSSKVDRVRLLEEFLSGASPPPGGHPPSETESRVREAWEQTLGHGSFGLNTSFFEAGGDSLSIFKLVDLLRGTFGIESRQLDDRTVYRHSTISDLSRWIEAVVAGGEAPPDHATPILVPLRKGSGADLAPLFLIATPGGGLGAYEKLTKALGTSREIMGVRDPFLWGERDPTEGFRRWVDGYLEAILHRQPRGPYFLLAYSSAGSFGYEIALRLRQAGQEVALLALVDPVALDRSSKWRYGYWALRAVSMRALYRKIVRFGGWLRLPVIRLLTAIRRAEARNDHTFSPREVSEITEAAVTRKGHLLTLSALLELNTGLPFALAEEDFQDLSPDRYLEVLLARVRDLTPDIDPSMIERIAIQYNLQTRSQHAYRLSPFDGPTLLVEPESHYAGLVEAQLRPYVPNLRKRTFALGPVSSRTGDITERFRRLRPHYLCMRDDTFVRALARELDAALD